MFLDWSLKNQTLAFRGLMLGGTMGGTAIIVYDNRQGNRNVKKDNDEKYGESCGYFNQKEGESHRYFNQKFDSFDERLADLKKADNTIQLLMLSLATSVLKGIQGDTTEIENLVKNLEKAMECMKEGGC